MRQGDEAVGRGPSDIGLALLLDGGVSDAIASVEEMITTAQRAGVRALTDFFQVRAAGATAASVTMSPPATTPEPLGLEETAPDIIEAVRPAARFAALPAVRPATAAQVDLTPVSVLNSDAVAPAPLAPTVAPSNSTLIQLSSFAPTPAVEPAISIKGDRSAISDKGLLAPAASGLGGDALVRGSVRPGRWAPEALPPATQAEGPATDALPQRAFAPPPAQLSQGGPTRGDVFLDGARVGSWLADHLAHEVGRPQAGGTAFDPRLTPAWPGTLQGG